MKCAFAGNRMSMKRVATAIRQALQTRGQRTVAAQFHDFIQVRFYRCARVGVTLRLDAARRQDDPAPTYGNVSTLPPQAAEPSARDFFSSMNVLGQILGCYLVCASSQGLALIDQHAAHERVAFEKLRRDLDSRQSCDAKSARSRRRFELSAGEIALLEEKLALSGTFGYLSRTVGPGATRLPRSPRFCRKGIISHALRRMIADLAEVDKSRNSRQHLEERLATIACHSVIRANRMLEMGEMRALLQELDQTEFATQCPHGRPVLMGFSRDELDRMFKRVV